MSGVGVFVSGANMERTDIRLALPSKGRLEVAALDFLSSCGLAVHKPNPRQYQAVMPSYKGILRDREIEGVIEYIKSLK